MLPASIFFGRGETMKKEKEKRHTADGLLAVGMRFFAILLTAAILFPVGAGAAWSEENVQPCVSLGRRVVVPSGRAVGIKLFSDGVLVVGLAEIETQKGLTSPAKRCGLKTGDIIETLNGHEVNTVEEVQEAVHTGGATMKLQVLRNGKTVSLNAQAVQDKSGTYRLGAWLRDSMAGIGTVTFYDPESGMFAALGHGINDIDTAQLMPLDSGAIMYATVSEVKKGEAGAPGELRGAFRLQQDLGTLYANTSGGVFGVLDEEGRKTVAGTPVEVAHRREVKVGKATILSNLSGDRVEEYEAEIVRLYPAGEGTRNLMIRVTDPKLLEKSGGIVQGMSGSPILQNGRLVGAVTHVLVNDPTTGYGILAENMLERAETVRAVS